LGDPQMEEGISELTSEQRARLRAFKAILTPEEGVLLEVATLNHERRALAEKLRREVDILEIGAIAQSILWKAQKAETVSREMRSVQELISRLFEVSRLEEAIRTH